MTSSRLDRMEPSSEAATTVNRFLYSANRDTKISTTLPNVALISPPTTSPKRTARSCDRWDRAGGRAAERAGGAGRGA
jgi:hypothetical protein